MLSEFIADSSKLRAYFTKLIASCQNDLPDLQNWLSCCQNCSPTLQNWLSDCQIWLPVLQTFVPELQIWLPNGIDRFTVWPTEHERVEKISLFCFSLCPQGMRIECCPYARLSTWTPCPSWQLMLTVGLEFTLSGFLNTTPRATGAPGPERVVAANQTY